MEEVCVRDDENKVLEKGKIRIIYRQYLIDSYAFWCDVYLCVGWENMCGMRLCLVYFTK